MKAGPGITRLWRTVGSRWLPFADAATAELPMARLLRLSLFQVSVGMVLVLTNGTLNRVMIVELGAPAALVSVMLALPVLFAPVRALIGHRSDEHRSALGWRRVPYIWLGTMCQFGGLAIMPFALLVLSGQGHGPAWAGQIGAGLAFLLVGLGTHTAQTAGLALATDLAPAHARPRVVALLYVTLLVGMTVSSLLLGALLAEFTPTRLVQVVQGAAVMAMALNLAALWKQEPRGHRRTSAPRRPFREAWREFAAHPGALRLLTAVALGSAAFSMQDILLEPYGGQVLAMTVGQTTLLTALLAGGTLLALSYSARALARGLQPVRLSGLGAVVGLAAFAAVILSGAFAWPALFQAGTVLIGIGGGLFSVGLLVEVMRYADRTDSGIALGAWGAVQATATGVAVGTGGLLRDGVVYATGQGWFGPAFAGPEAAYNVVYHLEIGLLFLTLIALGPLVRYRPDPLPEPSARLSLAEFPN